MPPITAMQAQLILAMIGVMAWMGVGIAGTFNKAWIAFICACFFPILFMLFATSILGS